MIRKFFTILLLSLLAACAPASPALPTDIPEANTPEAVPTAWRSVTTFTENGVAVEIVVQIEPSGQGWLSGTFTPLEEHFHLYSNDLPRNGLNGQGRPILLEIISPGHLKTIGALQANQQTILRAQGLLVYPDGPVTLSLPIAWTESTSTSTELSVTYMACSEELCLKPVIDKRVSVEIPDLKAQ